MRRRRWIQSALALPAAVALPSPAAAQQTARQSQEEGLGLVPTPPDAVAYGLRRFFTVEQFAALEKLAEILVPAVGGRPGAKDARVTEFLDFLIRESSPERQELYRAGLDSLNREAARLYQKLFSGIDAAEAGRLLAPLGEAWAYQSPADPRARFLRQAREDILRATLNSREWAESASSRRGGAGTSYYWRSLD